MSTALRAAYSRSLLRRLDGCTHRWDGGVPCWRGPADAGASRAPAHTIDCLVLQSHLLVRALLFSPFPPSISTCACACPGSCPRGHPVDAVSNREHCPAGHTSPGSRSPAQVCGISPLYTDCMAVPPHTHTHTQACARCFHDSCMTAQNRPQRPQRALS